MKSFQFYEKLIIENKIKLTDLKDHKNQLGDEIKQHSSQIKLFHEFVRSSIHQFRQQRRQEFEQEMYLEPDKFRFYIQFQCEEERPNKKQQQVNIKEDKEKKKKRKQSESEKKEKKSQFVNKVKTEPCEQDDGKPKNMEDLIFDEKYQEKLEKLKEEHQEKDKLLKTSYQKLQVEFHQCAIEEEALLNEISAFKQKKALLVVTLKEYLLKILKEPSFLYSRLKKAGLEIFLSEFCFVIKEMQTDWLPSSLETESKNYILITMKMQQEILQSKEDIRQILQSIQLDKQINYSQEKLNSISQNDQIKSFAHKLSSDHQSFLIEQDEQFESSLGISYCMDKDQSVRLQDKIVVSKQLEKDYDTYRKQELKRFHQSSLSKISSFKSYEIIKQNFIYLVGIEQAEQLYTKFLEEIRRIELKQMKNNNQLETAQNTQEDYKDKYLKKKLVESQVQSQERAMQWHQEKMETFQAQLSLNNTQQTIL